MFAADLSRSDVVAVGVGAAAAPLFQLTVVHLHADFPVAAPSLGAHTRHVTRTHVHTLGLQTERWREVSNGISTAY